MKHILILSIFVLLLHPLNLFSQAGNEDFLLFYNDFKSAVFNRNQSKIASYTEWSKLEGGSFSVNVTNKKDFMNNVYETIFNDFWNNAFKNAELDNSISSQNDGIKLSKITISGFGCSETDNVYCLDNYDNALLFKLINGEYKLIACIYTGEGD